MHPGLQGAGLAVLLLCWQGLFHTRRSSHLNKDSPRKCRLSVGSLMLVLVTSNWKYVVWILRINRLLLLDRTAENAEAV